MLDWGEFMKWFAVFFALLPAIACGQNTTIREMTEATTWDDDDLFYMIANPAGTPLDRKIKAGTLLRAGRSQSDILVAASDSPASVQLVANYICDGTDDEVQINAAIAALPDGGGTVHLSPGNFVAEGITPVEAVTIRGAGMYATKISLPSSASSAMFAAAADTSFYGGGLYDLELYGDAGATQNGIDFSAVTTLEEFFIERCKISYFAIGINGTAGTGNDRFLCVTDCLLWNNTTGMVGKEHPRIVNCDFRSNDVGLTGRLNDCSVEFCKWAYNRVGVEPSAGQEIRSSSFVNCGFYGNTETALAVSNRILVSGCRFQGVATGDCCAIKINGTSGISIVNNRFGSAEQKFTLGCVLFANTENIDSVSIVGNMFYCYGAGGIAHSAGAAYLRTSTICGNTFYVDGSSYGIDGNNGVWINNLVEANNFRLVSGSVGVRLKANNGGGQANLFADNIFSATSSVTATGIDADLRKSTVVNNITRLASPLLTVRASDTATLIAGNTGYVTEAKGTATVPDDATHIDVTHGLATTPVAQCVQVTPTNNLGNAAKFWISDLGASTFRINVDADPGVGTATFSWRAELY